MEYGGGKMDIELGGNHTIPSLSLWDILVECADGIC